MCGICSGLELCGGGHPDPSGAESVANGERVRQTADGGKQHPGMQQVLKSIRQEHVVRHTIVRVDKHVDDLAQCAVGRQTVVIRRMLEAAEIITFACDRLNLLISPKSTLCCSKTETLLRRGLLYLGIHFTSCVEPATWVWTRVRAPGVL